MSSISFRSFGSVLLSFALAHGAIAGEFDVQSDLSYGSHPSQLFDWYKPKNPTFPTPVVVHQHGGAGILDKSAVLLEPNIALVRMLLENGITVMSIDNRPLHHFALPAPVEDVALSIQYFRANATQYGIDPQAVVLWGHSSGGAVGSAATYGIDYQNLGGDAVAQQSSRPQAFLNWRGLVNWTLMHPQFPGVMFGKPTVADVDLLALQQASGSWLVSNVARTFTPPVFSYYDYNENPPPLINPHDATLMKDLHTNLQAFPEASSQSVIYQTLTFPQIVYGEPEAQVEWIRARAGVTGPMSLGLGVAGTGGVTPALSASGDFSSGGAFSFQLQASTAQVTTLLMIIGFTPAYAPLLGGVLVPTPNITVVVGTDANGTRVINGALPPNQTPGVAYMQFFQADPGGSFGHAASNAIKIYLE